MAEVSTRLHAHDIEMTNTLKERTRTCQNPFDDPTFLESYLEFRAADTGLNALIEEPTMAKLLPKVEGKRALDLGCGYGRMCRLIASRRAAYVLGIDCSQQMLALARAQSSENDTVINYRNIRVEDFVAEPRSFDIIVSSLALHYIEDIETVFHKAYSGRIVHFLN